MWSLSGWEGHLKGWAAAGRLEGLSLPQEVVRSDFLCQHPSRRPCGRGAVLFTPGAFLLLLFRPQREKATRTCLLGRVPVPRGLSTLSTSEAHNKGNRGMLLDIPIPEECVVDSCGMQAGLDELSGPRCPVELRVW